MKYLHERRKALGGYLPQRRQKADKVPAVPPLSSFEQILKGSGEGREISTTMAFVRVLTALVRDKELGKRVVPIVPDEARTFGMEGMFRQLGIFAAEGQKYEPVDKDQVMFYREDKQGQILEEGINEAGAFSSWIAAATSYSHSNEVTVPFYIFYSMFGMQRVGDLAWAAADQRARGFLLGATAGRTTLNGEGLQHEDGHSHIFSSVIPNCVSYDPTYGYEVAVIIQDGLRRMVTNQEDVYYYITLMNENYEHPAMPQGVEAGILKGMYLLRNPKARTSCACSCWAAARSCARWKPRPSCSRKTGAWRPTCGARPASPSCAATASPPSAGTCCTPKRSRDSLIVEKSLKERPAGRWSPQRLHQDFADRSARSCRRTAATACSAPTASAARIRARSCVISSR
jgi:pyruvate dehydrogenase E1 component